jgi:hypothetical protein
MLHARARRLTAWIALAAMLLAALAPMVSHALARAPQVARALQDLCTVGGARLLVLVPDLVSEAAPGAALAVDASGEAPSALALIHCPFCLPVADRLGPPPAVSLHFFTAESGLARPDAQASSFLSAPRLPAWPRGPPTHS